MERSFVASGGMRRKGVIQGLTHFSKPCSRGPSVVEPSRPFGRAPAAGCALPLHGVPLSAPTDHTGAGSSCT